MAKKSMGILAGLAVMVGLAGLSTTGCGLDTPGTVQPPTDTTNFNPPTENVAPIDRSHMELKSPGR